VGGDGRATVRPDDEETGDDRGWEDICSSEKQGGRAAGLQVGWGEGWVSSPFSEKRSESSGSEREESEVEDMGRWTVGTVEWLLVAEGRRA